MKSASLAAAGLILLAATVAPFPGQGDQDRPHHAALRRREDLRRVGAELLHVRRRRGQRQGRRGGDEIVP